MQSILHNNETVPPSKQNGKSRSSISSSDDDDDDDNNNSEDQSTIKQQQQQERNGGRHVPDKRGIQVSKSLIETTTTTNQNQQQLYNRRQPSFQNRSNRNNNNNNNTIDYDDESSTSIGDPAAMYPVNTGSKFHEKSNANNTMTKSSIIRRTMQRRSSAGPSFGYENNLELMINGDRFKNKANQSRQKRNNRKDENYMSKTSTTDDDDDEYDDDDADGDDSEYDSVVQSSLCSGTSRYLSDPSAHGTRALSDGSVSHTSNTSLDLMTALGQSGTSFAPTTPRATASSSSLIPPQHPPVPPNSNGSNNSNSGRRESPSISRRISPLATSRTPPTLARLTTTGASPSRSMVGRSKSSSPLASLAYAATGIMNPSIMSPSTPSATGAGAGPINGRGGVARSKSSGFPIPSSPAGGIKGLRFNDENDMKLRNALNRIGNRRMGGGGGAMSSTESTDGNGYGDDQNHNNDTADDCSIDSIRSSKLEDLKEIFSTSRRNLKTKHRKRRTNRKNSGTNILIRCGSQSSLSFTAEDLLSLNGTPDDTSVVSSVMGGDNNTRQHNHNNNTTTSTIKKSTSNTNIKNNLYQKDDDDDDDSNDDDDDVSYDESQYDEDGKSICTSLGTSNSSSIDVLEESGSSFANASGPVSFNLQMLKEGKEYHDINTTPAPLLGPTDTGSAPASPEQETRKIVSRTTSTSSSRKHHNNKNAPKQQDEHDQYYQSNTSKMNASQETLPITNVFKGQQQNHTSSVEEFQQQQQHYNQALIDKRRSARSAKTNQIIESLVWFSFHIPRTVLEDLISHELALWRQQHTMSAAIKNSSSSSNHPRKAGSGDHKKKESATGRTSPVKSGSKLQTKSGHTAHSTKSSISADTFANDSAGNGKVENVNEDDKDNDVSTSEGSVSSLSDDGQNPLSADNQLFDANYSETLMRREGKLKSNDMIILPKAVQRESAILFVDMSGFTKLSTILDVESLSKVINSYFEMIVSEVISHGGDILKFAGDAFFAEWRVVEDEHNSNSRASSRHSKNGNRKNGSAPNPLSELNASLALINEISWDDDAVPASSMAVLYAAKCARAIVQKYSDYHVTTATGANAASANATSTTANAAGNGNGPAGGTSSGSGTDTAMLNVHCGIGVGHLVGLHVGDYKENADEEEATELRREFLLLGDPIEQVAKAAELAHDGQVMASPEAILALAFCCDLTEEQQFSDLPVCIAARDESFLKYESYIVVDNTNALQPYESLRMHCKALNHTALARLNLQMALYVHPVIRGDELALSAAIQAGKISQPTETLESRHRAEAELRSVFTMFITPIISARVTGIPEVDEVLFKTLGDIMHVTSRELDRYSGHLRQFIVDDKGVVLIATFGLRGSTFPNMVENNGLPAAYAIHRALKTELNVENRIGCTFGKVYCGVVGGVRRHEFAVMGAPVNLAARLMGLKVNNGILVDEAVREQCMGRYSFKSLPPVIAKGYDKPVPILEPIQMEAKASKKKKSTFPIIGRKAEKRTVLSVARGIIEEPLIAQSTMIFLTGESGMGKSALAVTILDELKKTFSDEKAVVITARSSSTETEQRIPLSSFRKIFMSVIRDRCEYDDGIEFTTKSSICSSTTAGKSLLSLRSMNSSSTRRGRLLASRMTIADTTGRGLLKGQFEKLSEESMTDFDSSPVSNKSSRSLRRAVAPPGLSHTQHRQQKNLKHTLQLSSHNRSSHGSEKQSKRKSESMSQSLHRSGLKEKLNRKEPNPRMSFAKAQSMRFVQPKQPSKNSKFRDECDESAASLDTNFQKQGSSGHYFEKLCWACEKLNYPFEYADIVGSQFLGFESATPITHVDGHVPTIDELVEFLSLAFLTITDHADLVTIFLDDFHWVDAFSWRIFRVLCKKAKKLILLSATRSHDKQALRRMSTAVTQERQLQSQMIEISLGPLDFSEIRELMATVLDHKKSAIPDALCTDIFQRTGGLPVYVVQVLENIKRKHTVEMVDGTLKWTAEGLIEKRNMATNKNGAVMEETFLSRFDALDVRVRKVLQTCAVLGLSFALSDVIKVHPEMEEFDIENALECAMDEMILVEQVEDDDEENENASVRSGSTRESAEDFDSNQKDGSSHEHAKTGDERFFQFSHAMWRKNVLATMLKERKMELHRLIAEAMEKDEVLILEQSDISRLLTLFDHWKSCGEFCKVAPLALAVGARLEEWDLAAQSLELYEDALEMAFEGVHPTDHESKDDDEWVQVKAKPIVLDLILRLHICMGMCHQRLGQEYQSILYFQDAYNIIKSASKMSGMSEALVMPIISSLCVLILEEEAADPQSKAEHLKLVNTFVHEAEEDGDAVHIGRSLALRALYFAKHGDFRGALDAVRTLETRYSIESTCEDMVAEYGRDFAMECSAESVQWLYLMGNHDEAETKAEKIISRYIPLLEPEDTDQMMYVVLPIIQVFSLLDRAEDADMLLKKYIINPYHDYASPSSEFWAPLFNPLAYLLEIIIMDDEEQHDPQVLDEMENWVLNEDNYHFDKELERKAHTIMGELCWRLALVKEDEEEAQSVLLQKARELLEPVAFYPHNEIFQKQTAQALLEAL